MSVYTLHDATRTEIGLWIYIGDSTIGNREVSLSQTCRLYASTSFFLLANQKGIVSFNFTSSRDEPAYLPIYRGCSGGTARNIIRGTSISILRCHRGHASVLFSQASRTILIIVRTLAADKEDLQAWVGYLSVQKKRLSFRPWFAFAPLYLWTTMVMTKMTEQYALRVCINLCMHAMYSWWCDMDISPFCLLVLLPNPRHTLQAIQPTQRKKDRAHYICKRGQWIAR